MLRLGFAYTGCFLIAGVACTPLPSEFDTDSSSPVSTSTSTSTSTSLSIGSTSESSTTDPTGSTPDPDTTGTTATDSTDSTSTGSVPADSSSSGAPVISCDNGLQDGEETDVDCGGSECDRCDEGQMCAQELDCQSVVCDVTTGLCVGPPALLWLDGTDETSIFTDDTCSTEVIADDDPVECWRSMGQIDTDFVLESGSGGRYEADGGVELNNDILVASGIYDRDLAEVAIFLVATEVTGTNSFDLNLNHPNQDGTGRYTAHLPWNSTRRLVWDPGNASSARLESEPDLVTVGETNIFELVNSTALDVREIRLNGDLILDALGPFVAPASDVSIGSSANLHVYDLRVYEPAPSEAQRFVIEGDLACRYDRRSQLATDHPYYSADDLDEADCP